MENLYNKEKRLETALEKLKSLSSSYSGGQNEINDIYVDENRIIYCVDRHAGGLYCLSLDI